jgi:hypothetical protein
LGFLGGWLIIFFAIYYAQTAFSLGQSNLAYISSWIWNLVTAILAILGGILGFLSKKASGFLIIVGGLLSIVLGLLYWFSNGTLIEAWQYSYFTSWGIGTPMSNLFLGITIEALIITVGGIINLISKSK